MSLRSRVDALLSRLRPGRLIIAMPGTGPPVRELPDGRGLVLRVPPSYEDNPLAGLTDAQRALIGPDDRVIVVRYADRAIDVTSHGKM